MTTPTPKPAARPLTCAERMPEPGDVITLDNILSKIERYDNNHGFIYARDKSGVFTIIGRQDVCERGVYVSRADGKSVLVREEGKS